MCDLFASREHNPARCSLCRVLVLFCSGWLPMFAGLLQSDLCCTIQYIFLHFRSVFSLIRDLPSRRSRLMHGQNVPRHASSVCVNPRCARNFCGKIPKVCVPNFYRLCSPALSVDLDSGRPSRSVHFLWTLPNSTSCQTGVRSCLRSCRQFLQSASRPLIPSASSPCKVSDSHSGEVLFRSLSSAVICQRP